MRLVLRTDAASARRLPTWLVLRADAASARRLPTWLVLRTHAASARRLPTWLVLRGARVERLPLAEIGWRFGSRVPVRPLLSARNEPRFAASQ